MYHVIAREMPVCQRGSAPVTNPTLSSEVVYLNLSGTRFDLVNGTWERRTNHDGAVYRNAAYEDLYLMVGGYAVAAVRVRRVIREEARHDNPTMSAESVVSLWDKGAQKEAQAPTPPSPPTISLREYYAGKFLAARLGISMNLGTPEEMAQMAVQRADALIAELNKTKS